MGIFALFKKQPEAILLEQLKAFYVLKETKPYEHSIMYNWWEGSIGNWPVAFQIQGKKMAIYIGKIEEVTDIYLVRTDAEQSEQSRIGAAEIARIVGPEGQVLSSQFRLGAKPPGEFDIPQLRLPALRDGIPKLSPSVQSVAIFEGHRGLSLHIEAVGATVETIDRDLALAQAMIRALQNENSHKK